MALSRRPVHPARRPATQHPRSSRPPATLLNLLPARTGLWDRVTVQWEVPHPEGKTAGAWDAHQHAWTAALAAGCGNLLVLEEDVFFDVASLQPSATHADAFLASTTPSNAAAGAQP